MDVKIGLVVLFVLGFSFTNGARVSVTYRTEILLIDQEPETQVKLSEEVGKNQLCLMCEEFAIEALNYFSENKTQTEIMKILHKSCSKMLSFKQECITLVDYYAPLFFLELATIQPGDFCQKFGLCEQVIAISPSISKNSCELCHHAVSKALIKLKDPDTQLEIIEVLLKACDAVETHVKKVRTRQEPIVHFLGTVAQVDIVCKKLVFEYAPLILVNAEEFLETNDICTILHACDLPSTRTVQPLPQPGKFLVSDS